MWIKWILLSFSGEKHVCIIVAYMLQQIKPSARVNQRNLGVDSSLEESSGREAGDGTQRSKPEGEVWGWKLEGGSPGRRSLWWLAREGCCALHSVNSGSVLNAVSFHLHNISVIVTDYIRFRIMGNLWLSEFSQQFLVIVEQNVSASAFVTVESSYSLAWQGQTWEVWKLKLKPSKTWSCFSAGVKLQKW